MLSKNVTVCLFAWNEANRILRGLENFNGIFEVLVVDNMSEDGTAGVVTAAGFRVIKVKNPGFIETPEVMNPVLAACSTPYILIASVSELVPVALLKKYASVADTNSHDIVRAYRESVTAGLSIPISGRPTRRFPGEIRFFKKGSVDYSNNQVHGRGVVTVSESRVLSVVTNASLRFYQFRDYDVSQTENKHRAYNDVLARQRYESGSRFSWVKMFLHASKQFLDAYVRFGSWKFGMLGFIHSFHRWYMEVGIWLRLWEWENGFDRAGVIDRNAAIRAQFESEVDKFKRGELTSHVQ